MSAEQLPESECPDPASHDTFMYCPYCTWQADVPPSIESRALALLDRWRDGWSEESDFPLLAETRALLGEATPDE